jgi:hypothetical protein
MEGSLVAYKVFTNGSVLQASEINDNLMRQSVMVFSNAAARTAAITSPLEGMLTWLEDVNRYESYNGTAWVSPFGTTLLNRTAFTSQTSVIVDNVFSSQFDTYKVFVTVNGSTNSNLTIVFRASGADLNSANYQTSETLIAGATVSGSRVTSQTFAICGVTRPSLRTYNEITIQDPFKAISTQFTSLGIDTTGGIQTYLSGNRFSQDISATGFKISMPAGAATGEIQTFGFRN